MQVAAIPLYFTNPILGVVLLILYYLFHSVKEARLINLMLNFICLSGSFNAFLKFLFQIPLHESLNNQCWWAFPSGHMQYGIVLWGMIWINCKFNKALLALFVFCLLLSSISMQYYNYHTFLEMLGALPPAILILLAYKTILDNKISLLYINLFSIVFQLIVIYVVQSPCINYHFTFFWLNLGCNVGLLISLAIKYDHQLTSLLKKNIALILFLIYVFIFQYVTAKYNTIEICFIAGMAFILAITLTKQI